MKYSLRLIFGLLLFTGACSPEISETIQPQVNQTINGKKEGLWIVKDFLGRKKEEGHYENGIKEGEWKVYTKDRKFYWQGKMENGYWVGWWYFTNAKNHIKLDALKYNKFGECIGHGTLKW